MIVKLEELTARGRRTRAALVSAGREVFEEQAFDAVRIDDVCSRAGVSHGTFYTYFDSKEALFREVAGVVVGEMFTASIVGPTVSDEPYARIEAANLLYLRAWASNSRLVRMLEQAAGADEGFAGLLLELREVFVRRGAEGLKRLQEQGLADPSLDPRLTAIMLGGMVEHFAHVWLDLGEHADEQAAVDLLTKLWARAIGLTPPSTPTSPSTYAPPPTPALRATPAPLTPAAPRTPAPPPTPAPPTPTSPPTLALRSTPAPLTPAEPPTPPTRPTAAAPPTPENAKTLSDGEMSTRSPEKAPQEEQ